MPTSNYPNENMERFYKELEDALNTHRSTCNFIIGDFNAKIGKKQDRSEAQVGPYGLGERNQRGTRLIQFAARQNMKIMNSFFKKKQQDRWIWRSPNGKVKNEIDYILSERMHVMKDVGTVKGLSSTLIIEW